MRETGHQLQSDFVASGRRGRGRRSRRRRRRGEEEKGQQEAEERVGSEILTLCRDVPKGTPRKDVCGFARFSSERSTERA